MTFPKITAAAAAAAVLGLGACTNTGTMPYPQTKAQQGAIMGGLLGAGIGAATSDDDVAETVIASAAVGALAGGLIGNQLDKQEAELRQNLSNDQISIVNTGTKLILSFPNDLTFATDSYSISPAVRSDLLKVAGSLQRYPNSTVQVIGHTDSDGNAAYNQGLSERRANAVADSIQAGGVSYNRMRTIGRGEEQPVASNLTPQGKAANRRVEVVVIPQGA